MSPGTHTPNSRVRHAILRDGSARRCVFVQIDRKRNFLAQQSTDLRRSCKVGQTSNPPYALVGGVRCYHSVRVWTLDGRAPLFVWGVWQNLFSHRLVGGGTVHELGFRAGTLLRYILPNFPPNPRVIGQRNSSGRMLTSHSNLNLWV
jgi:hypothetical protein